LSKPCHASVSMGGKVRTFEQMVRKFMKLTKESGVLKEVSERRFYVSKGQKRRRKKYASKARSKNHGSK